MKKLQPQGGYEEIEASNQIYTKMIAQTAIWKLTPTTTSLKIKLGQNLSKERKEKLTERLTERGEALDKATLEAIENNRG